MLSRHFLRAKALQSVYAYVTTGENNPLGGEKNFEYNISHLNELGVMQLSTLPQFVYIAERMIDDAKQKFMPTEEDLNPNMRLVNNRFIQCLADNLEYKRLEQQMQIDWSGDFDSFRSAYLTFRSSETYKDYLADPNDCYETDHQFALVLFKYLMNHELLRESFISRSLLWDDDFDQVAQYNFQMIREYTEDQFDESSAIMLMHDTRVEKDVEAYQFALDLFRNTIRHMKENEDLIRKFLQNWDFDRIAFIDMLLLNMAINELMYCPSIPERVTVDEYIELSKEFSTDKSKLFINGVLDKMLLELRKDGKIVKTGRGLYNPNIDSTDE